MLKNLKSRIGVIAGTVGATLLGLATQAHAQLVTLPSTGSTTAALETQSSSIFNEFVILVLVGAGITLGAMVLSYFVGKIVGAGKIALNRKRGGRRRRR